MTDLERMHTSKLYVDRLANGEDPISGEDLPADTVLNNVYLCRAFGFISSILDEVIKNGGVVSAKNDIKKPFTITEEQRSKIRMSEEPVVVTSITNRISAVLDRDVKRIAPFKVAEWLEKEGLLERVLSEDTGRYERVATSAGEVIGIETKEATYKDMTIKKNYYNLNAQAFIIANLEAIAEQSFVELEEKPAPKKKQAAKKSKK
ncbi:MAG: hypothetical protein Q4F70_02880 [Clostridia bacterium]|nr:hypothetical protein [Clostridia bacterium]